MTRHETNFVAEGSVLNDPLQEMLDRAAKQKETFLKRSQAAIKGWLTRRLRQADEEHDRMERCDCSADRSDFFYGNG